MNAQFIPLYTFLLEAQTGKKPVCQWRRCKFDPRVGKIPCRKKWQPISVGKLLLPGKFHGSRSLVGYSPWGHKRVGHDWATKQHFPYISSKATVFPLLLFELSIAHPLWWVFSWSLSSKYLLIPSLIFFSLMHELECIFLIFKGTVFP